MTDLERARALLDGDPTLTCAFVRGEKELSFRMRGVRPLLHLAEEGMRLEGYAAADRVVGRAAALLYALLGGKEVYAYVLSESAAETFRAHKIAYGYQTLTRSIINREGTGPCPMEEATEGISDPAAALTAIRNKLASLK